MDAKNVVETILFYGLGSMQKDPNPRQINYNAAGEPTGEQNYIDAQNVSKISLVQEGDDYWYAVNGNTIAVSPPTISPQDKFSQVTLTQSTGETVSIEFLNLNGSSFLTPVIATFGPTTGNLFNDTNSFATAILVALTGAGYGGSVASNIPNIGDIQIAITAPTGFDYNILDNGSTSPLTITVIQEAWDESVVGLCYPTGSKDWLNNLFITSSTVGSDPAQYQVIGTQTDINGQVEVILPGNLVSNLPVGYTVIVEGVEGTTEANGTWIISASTFFAGQTFITLYNSTWNSFHPYISGGELTINIYGFLNISVSQYSIDNKTWTTYNLLQTKQINSRYIHPYRDVEADEANDVINLYMTDNYDVMRIFSYTGPYMNNGAIQYYNPLGEYDYEGIYLQMQLILGNGRCLVSDTNVINGGGAVLTGNWRYSAVLQYADLTSTLPSLLSSPVEIFKGNMTVPNTVIGNTAGEASNKQVEVTIGDIPAGVFSFCQLIGVNYVGGAETAYVIKTVPISNNATTLTIIHFGDEAVENYDATLLTQQGVSFTKAGSLKIISDTLMAANITTETDYDFGPFVTTWQHSISKEPNILNPVGDDRNNWATLGDYQDPAATFSMIGFMDNETYRFGASFISKDGTQTNVYWIDDIRMDNFTLLGIPYNRANIFADNRRLGSFANYDLSPSDANPEDNNSYVTALTFSNIDFSFSIGGVPVSQLVDKVLFYRIDNTSNGLNEVLGCGLICRHVYNYAASPGGTIYASNALNNITSFDNPYLFTDYNTGLPHINSTPAPTQNFCFQPPQHTYSYGAWYNAITTDIRTKECSFYCPDTMWGQLFIASQPSDSLICYGQPEFRYSPGGVPSLDVSPNNTFSNGGNPASALWSMFIKLTGQTNQGSEPTWNQISMPIVALGNFSGQVAWAPGGGIVWYDSSFLYDNGAGTKLYYDTPIKYLIAATNDINQVNGAMGNGGGGIPTLGAFDLGLYYTQYYRDLGSVNAYTNGSNKFGAINIGVYVNTGTVLEVANVTAPATIRVLGGDTFTQKTYFKKTYPSADSATGHGYDAGSGVTVAFFSQNRFNFNMRNGDAPGMMNYPAATVLGDWLNNDTGALDNQSYDIGYTPRGTENQIRAFNATTITASHQGSLEIFSPVKVQGSISNAFRQIPPLNSHSEQTDKGDITGLVLIDQELFVLQPRAVWRDFYTDIGTFRGSGTGEVTLASGLPFSKPAQMLSNNGCSNRFSIIQGKGDAGEDVACWIDIINKKVMKLSRNGVEDITGKMRTWFNTNLNSDLGDVPILGNMRSDDIEPTTRNSITGVFDEKRKEFIWTIVQKPTGVEWSAIPSYAQDTIVYEGTRDFNNIQTAYRATTATTPGNDPLTNLPQEWEVVDEQFAYTVAYSLLANQKQGGWSMFVTPLPYFYAQWKNTYLSAYPTMSNNGIYLHDVGDEMTWYLSMSGSLTANGSLTYVNNAERERYKEFFNVESNSLIVPAFINFNTEQYASFLQASDFNNISNILWRSQIKKDVLTSTPPGHNDQWTSPMRGNYMISQFVFLQGQGQKLGGLSTKYIKRLKY